jgi:hypothetical protein
VEARKALEYKYGAVLPVAVLAMLWANDGERQLKGVGAAFYVSQEGGECEIQVAVKLRFCITLWLK